MKNPVGLKFRISKFFLISLIISLVLLVISSIYAGYLLKISLNYSHVINLSGKIRGDIQRFTKLYFANVSNNKLKSTALEIDNYIFHLKKDINNLNLPLIDTKNFLTPLEIEKCWNTLKGEVFKCSQPYCWTQILNLSEECWVKADKITDLYQKISQRNLRILQFFYYLIIVLGGIVNLSLLYLLIVKNTFGKLLRKAHFDALTGVYNRSALCEIYPLLIKSEYLKPIGLIVFDIDNFKKINDTYGHLVGDIVLKKVSEVVKKHLRRNDIFARWGGEEFLILLPQTDLEGSLKVAEKLRKAIEELNIPELKGRKVTASFGITVIKNSETLNEAVLRADEALYEAKRNGKNQVKFKV